MSRSPIDLGRGPGTWVSGPCRALEHTFDLAVVDEGDLVERLAPLLSSFREPPGSPVDTHYRVVRSDEAGYRFLLEHEGVELTSASSGEDLARVLGWHVNRSVIRTSRERYVLMHAAAVVRSGVTVIMPADQECGKTTLTAGLLRAGFDYVTDEAVALAPADGFVETFPKTLSIDPGSWPLFPELEARHQSPRARQWNVSATELGATPCRGRVAPPRVVLFPKYVAGAQTELQPLTRAEAVRRMSLMTFEFREQARRNLRVLAEAASRAVAYALPVGDLGDAVAAVSALVEDLAPRVRADAPTDNPTEPSILENT